MATQGRTAVHHNLVTVIVIVAAVVVAPKTAVGMTSSSSRRTTTCTMMGMSMGVGVGTPMIADLVVGTRIILHVVPISLTRTVAGDHAALVAADTEAGHAVVRATRGNRRIQLFSRVYRIVLRLWR